MNYWSVVIQSRPFQPTSTLLIKLVESLINSEPEPDKVSLKKVKWISEHTHEKIDENLAIVELAVFRNWDKGLNCEITFGSKSFYLYQLYTILNDISQELSAIVIDVAKKYNFEIPQFNMSNQKSGNIKFDDD
jgi:hypothetical protein